MTDKQHDFTQFHQELDKRLAVLGDDKPKFFFRSHKELPTLFIHFTDGRPRVTINLVPFVAPPFNFTINELMEETRRYCVKEKGLDDWQRETHSLKFADVRDKLDAEIQSHHKGSIEYFTINRNFDAAKEKPRLYVEFWFKEKQNNGERKRIAFTPNLDDKAIERLCKKIRKHLHDQGMDDHTGYRGGFLPMINYAKKTSSGRGNGKREME